ncbi:MAG: hypothetical protein ACOCZ8_00250 [Bacteroidota bacterium]
MTRLHTLLSLALLALLLTLTGCEEESPSATLDAARQDAEARSELEQVFQYVDDAANQQYNGTGKTTNTILEPCIDTTWKNLDLVNKQGELELEFTGTDGCLCKDGITRFGKVIVSWEGGYRQEGTKSTTTLEDYFIKKPFDDEKVGVEGTRTVENLGNSSGNFRYRSIVNGATLNYPDNTTITWSSDLISERVSGEGTFDPRDDVYTITGTSNGTTRKGDNFDGTIGTPLTFDMGCLFDSGVRQFIDGEVTYETANNTLRLNYGYSDGTATGECDRKVEVQFNELSPQVIDLY